jgi:hypothetical protein
MAEKLSITEKRVGKRGELYLWDTLKLAGLWERVVSMIPLINKDDDSSVGSTGLAKEVIMNTNNASCFWSRSVTTRN